MRTQTESPEQRERISLENGIDTTNLPDLARQEFKTESDINRILQRFGVNPNTPMTSFMLGNAPPSFTEVDFNIDLQTGLDAIRHIKAAHSRLPKDLRDRYPTFDSLLHAIDIGEITINKEAQAKATDAKLDTKTGATT